MLDHTGISCIYGNIRLPIETTSKKLIKQVIQIPWDKFVASNLNRKDWHLNTIDTRLNTIAYNKLQNREQSLMDAILTGKHITNDLVSKFQPKQDDKCVLCGRHDSRLHRIFHCPELASTRLQYKSTLDVVKQWTTTQQIFAMPPVQPGLVNFLTEVQHEDFQFQLPPKDDALQHLFVDGTAFFNDHPWLVISGAAVVFSQPGSTTSTLVIRKRVPGIIQNSYIGELYAILLALNTAWNIHLYTDCQTLVDEILYIQQHRALPQKWAQVHHRLWTLVAQHICLRPTECITIQKVAAHQNWKLITDPDLRWQAYVNSRVDFHAKQSIVKDNADSFRARNEAYNKQTLLQQTTCDYYSYLTEISKIIVDNKPRKIHTVENQFDPHQDLLQPCAHVAVTVSNHPTLETFQSFPWGPVFLWRIHQWAQHLTWSNHHGCCSKDISDIELTADFILFTNSEPPINLSKGQEKQYGIHSNWKLRDLCLEADALGTIPFSQHVQLFRRALQWMNKHYSFRLFPCPNKRKVDSLRPLGLSAWHRGYSCRPKLACGERTVNALRKYFVTENGTRRDLSVPFSVHGRCNLDHPAELL